MAGKTLTRADLTEAVYQKDIVTKDHAADLVGQVLETIGVALEEGENVKLSSFGVFTERDKAKRMGAQSQKRSRGTDRPPPGHSLQCFARSQGKAEPNLATTSQYAVPSCCGSGGSKV